jgi:hypothetical protein
LIGGKFYEPLGGWYHATRFAVEGLSDSLRIELKPCGIDVVLIEPGPIRTEWGAIARAGLLRSSADTAYAGQARSVARMLETADNSRASSGPGRCCPTPPWTRSSPAPTSAEPLLAGMTTARRTPLLAGDDDRPAGTAGRRGPGIGYPRQRERTGRDLDAAGRDQLHVPGQLGHDGGG